MSDQFAYTSNEPVDRLTRICDRLIEAMKVDPEYVDGDAAIFLLSSRVDDSLMQTAGIGTYGFDDSMEYFTMMLVHVQGTARALGLRINILGANVDGEVYEL